VQTVPKNFKIFLFAKMKIFTTRKLINTNKIFLSVNFYRFYWWKYSLGIYRWKYTTPLYSFTDGFIPSVKGTQTVGKFITDGISDETNPSESWASVILIPSPCLSVIKKQKYQRNFRRTYRWIKAPKKNSCHKLPTEYSVYNIQW